MECTAVLLTWFGGRKDRDGRARPTQEREPRRRRCNSKVVVDTTVLTPTSHPSSQGLPLRRALSMCVCVSKTGQPARDQGPSLISKRLSHKGWPVQCRKIIVVETDVVMYAHNYRATYGRPRRELLRAYRNLKRRTARPFLSEN